MGVLLIVSSMLTRHMARAPMAEALEAIPEEWGKEFSESISILV